MRVLSPGRTVAAALAALALTVLGCGQRDTATPSSRQSEPGAAERQPPRTALDFSLTTFDGETVRLRDLRGKPLVLNFWASWSSRCVSRASALDALYQEHKAKGLQVLGIGVDAEENVRAKVEERKLSYPVGVGAETARRYGVTELPHTFFISREGKILASLPGGHPEECLGPGAEMVLASEGSEEYQAARDRFDAAHASFDAQEAFRQANKTYLQAAAIQDGGDALGEEWHRLMREAVESYERAVALKPDLWQALFNLSAALLRQANASSGAEAERLCRLALEKAMAAHRVKPGAGAYNAACAYALLGEPEKCREWLATTREFDALPPVEHMQSDPDLDSVRDEEWFQEYLQR